MFSKVKVLIIPISQIGKVSCLQVKLPQGIQLNKWLSSNLILIWLSKSTILTHSPSFVLALHEHHLNKHPGKRPWVCFQLGERWSLFQVSCESVVALGHGGYHVSSADGSRSVLSGTRASILHSTNMNQALPTCQVPHKVLAFMDLAFKWEETQA